jgi:hypothetical protein
MIGDDCLIQCTREEWTGEEAQYKSNREGKNDEKHARVMA